MFRLGSTPSIGSAPEPTTDNRLEVDSLGLILFVQFRIQVS